MKSIAVAFASVALLTSGAFAQSTSAPVPPPNAMKLSAMIAKVESRDKFLYLSDIEWSQSGYYEITYYTTDKAKVQLNLDPVSGQPR
ncbi:PepSY domain-containing protein [Labrys monachus]|uniref:PepSY domain-containing protein n=1 Tax=Labrys monachus TaxID=217067 RepID=A0ABU0FA23_9HYPH|nr:PepSY domain-containing protein [Labrys monachus]MDQ0391468.1 hypothetical protein [Labrys monachus]